MAKIHFFYSVMNAGKTSHLLQAHHNYKNLGWKPILFTPSIDTRSKTGTVSSRIGISASAEILLPSTNIFKFISDFSVDLDKFVVLIDEVQFVTKDHIQQLCLVADKLNIPVMCYGLKNNAFAELFSESIEKLLAVADDIKEIKTICKCGKKATQIMRFDTNGIKINSGNVVDIGAEEKYISVCRKHWFECNTIQDLQSLH